MTEAGEIVRFLRTHHLYCTAKDARLEEAARLIEGAATPAPVQDDDAVEWLDKATIEQIEQANDAVAANLNEWGVPKYDSAFGYACALAAVIQSDARRLSTGTALVEALTRPLVSIENRTPGEVFDIMCDRIKGALAARGGDNGGKYKKEK